MLLQRNAVKEVSQRVDTAELYQELLRKVVNESSKAFSLNVLEFSKSENILYYSSSDIICDYSDIDYCNCITAPFANNKILQADNEH